MVHLSYGAIQFEALCYYPANVNCGTKKQIFSGINNGTKSIFSLDDKAKHWNKTSHPVTGSPTDLELRKQFKSILQSSSGLRSH